MTNVVLYSSIYLYSLVLPEQEAERVKIVSVDIVGRPSNTGLKVLSEDLGALSKQLNLRETETFHPFLQSI